MKINQKMIPTIIIAFTCLTCFGFSQTATSNILLGQTITFDSEILEETRDVFVSLPDNYEASKESFPVLYVLDGETKFYIASAIVNFLTNNRSIPNMIVVGIPNTIRNRDFTPVNNPEIRNTGGADNFNKFLSEEVMTYINGNYRTMDYKILFGHSLTGMSSIYTLFANPGLFDAYITASPYLMNEEEYALDIAEEILKEKSDFKEQLYISIGDEPDYFNSLDRLTTLLTSNQSGINWAYEKYENEDHGSIPLRSITDGLGFIFSDWRLDNEIAMQGLDAIKSHYKNRMEKYGFTTKITEATLNVAGYRLLQAGEFGKSIEVFKYNVELYPNSANVYDSLGDGYDGKGKTKKALKNYRKAVELGKLNNDVNLPAFENNVKRLSNQ